MKYSIALVEYLNTLPFSEGLKRTQHDAQFNAFHVTPAQCAQLFDEGKVDISLCPVGALHDLPPHQVCGNYCIGADGPVGTVVLLSKVPLHEITAVRLDDHSRTSNLLLQILASRLWKRDWDFYRASGELPAESCLMIGDKVFAHRDEYPYQYDLAAAWKELTGLPMVFAVWIKKHSVPEEIVDQLDSAFEKGMSLVQSHDMGLAQWQTDYLLHNISYPLDDAKREAMQLYMSWASMLETETVNR
jgi:chorismate dehydratase